MNKPIPSNSLLLLVKPALTTLQSWRLARLAKSKNSKMNNPLVHCQKAWWYSICHSSPVCQHNMSASLTTLFTQYFSALLFHSFFLSLNISDHYYADLSVICASYQARSTINCSSTSSSCLAYMLHLDSLVCHHSDHECSASSTHCPAWLTSGSLSSAQLITLACRASPSTPVHRDTLSAPVHQDKLTTQTSHSSS